MGQVYVWKEAPAGEIVIDTTTGLDPAFERDKLHALKRMLG